MSQVKIFGVREKLLPRRQAISDAIHSCVMEVLGLPAGKRAHRFFPLDREDFFMPDGRTDSYTIVELTMVTGRSKETRKRLVRLLFDRIFERTASSRRISKSASWKARRKTGGSEVCTATRPLSPTTLLFNRVLLFDRVSSFRLRAGVTAVARWPGTLCGR